MHNITEEAQLDTMQLKSHRVFVYCPPIALVRFLCSLSRNSLYYIYFTCSYLFSFNINFYLFFSQLLNLDLLI